MKVIMSLCAAITFSLCLSFTSVSNSTTYFVQSLELTPNTYKSVFLASMENDLVSIEEACVPAHVLKINCSMENQDQAKQFILNFLSSNSEMEEIEILENFTSDDFAQKCSNARIGR